MNLQESQKGYLKLLGIFFLLGFVLLFRNNVCERVIVNGVSMAPTFRQDEICWVNKISDKYERYDVVIAKAPDNSKIIKRIIGVPGDEILIQDGTIFINGEIIDNSYDFALEDDYTERFFCDKNEYYLLGDNRQHSVDSRVFGAVNEKDLKGKVVFRFFPFNRVTKI